MKVRYFLLLLLIPVVWLIVYAVMNPSLEGEVRCFDANPLHLEPTPSNGENSPITVENVDLLTLTATLQQGDSVTDVEFTPDGKWLVASSSTEVKIWDLSTQREIHHFSGFSRQILSLAVSSDGKMLAAGGSDQRARVWDLTTFSEVAAFDFPQGVYDVLFAANDTKLITGSGEEYSLTLWDISNPTSANKLRDDSVVIDSVALHPAGRCLAISELPRGSTGVRLIKLVDMETGKEKTFPKPYNGDITKVVFSPDGNWLASAGGDGTVRLWDITIKEQLLVLNHQATVYSVAFDPTSTILAAVGDLGRSDEDSGVTLWDLRSGSQLRKLTGHSLPVSAVAFNPTGDLLASGSFDGTIQVWSVDTSNGG